MNPNPRIRLQTLLRDLFLADSADLDFGIYKILNARRVEINTFLETRLHEIIEAAFTSAKAADLPALQSQIEAAREQVKATLGAGALTDAGEVVPLYASTPLGQQVMLLREKASTYTVSDALRTRVYNDLHTFFARYYDDGDFLPKRRRGRGETYAIPYNGEETLLHWANRDQYYIKTGDRYAAYRFTVDTTAVSVEIVQAQTPVNNNKSEARVFLLADENAVAYDAERRALTLRLQHKPAPPREAKSSDDKPKPKTQEECSAEMHAQILDAVPDAALRGALAVAVGEKNTPRLLKHITNFTRRNTSDFFLHKDLHAFLTRELDFYLKNDILNTDELLVGDGTVDLDNLRRARAIQNAARPILDFLAQLEEFQKSLFLKRKFVLDTHYAATLDRIPESLWPQILQSDAQMAEWRALYTLNTLIERDGVLSTGLDLDFLRRHPHLMADTRHFAPAFVDVLLASWDGVDAQTDGVCLHSENLQALHLLHETYRGKVKCIYIDPPYNTGSDGFLYKDSYQHSSWLSMMHDRLTTARDLMSDDGAIFISIDDGEQAELRTLMNQVFNSDNFLANIVWQKKYGPANDAKGISATHEHLVAYSSNADRWRPGLLERDTDQLSAFTNPDSDPRGLWRASDFSARTYSGSCDYIIEGPTGKKFSPPPSRSWITRHERFTALLADNRITFGTAGNGRPMQKKFLSEVKAGITPETWWDREKAGDNKIARYEMKDLFPENLFSTPKPLQLIGLVVETGDLSPDDCIFDFFAGSGTTGHTVINLNRKVQTDNDTNAVGTRRYLLTEMGDHFHTVLLPRLKKTVYTDNWKDGVPQSANGLPHTIRYHTVEQYEDTLSGLQHRPDAHTQQALDVFGEEFLLHYYLQYATDGSPNLLNIERFHHPFAYKICTVQNGTPTESPVDLPETFRYLLGLTVVRRRVYWDGARRHVTCFGTMNDTNVVVVWRDSPDSAADTAALLHDRTFITETVLPDLLPDNQTAHRLFVNGTHTIPHAESIEPEFLRRMWHDARAPESKA